MFVLREGPLLQSAADSPRFRCSCVRALSFALGRRVKRGRGKCARLRGGANFLFLPVIIRAGPEGAQWASPRKNPS